MTKLLMLGNCQAEGLAKLITAMTDGEVTATWLQLNSMTMKRIKAGEIELSSLISANDLIFWNPNEEIVRLVDQCCPEKRSAIRRIPGIVCPAYHPDFVGVTNGNGALTEGPMGGPSHSSIAFYGWSHGFDLAQTAALFREEVFEHLGFFEYWNSSKKVFADLEKDTGMPFGSLFERWSSQGCWMHIPNHPKLFVLADLAREILKREGIPFILDVEQAMVDNLAYLVYPVYTEIGSRLGVHGNYQFKLRPQPGRTGREAVNLEGFITASFENFSKYPKKDLVCRRLTSSRFQSLGSFLENRRTGASVRIPASRTDEHPQPSKTAGNPYRDLPDYQFWRRVIERMPTHAVNPVVRPRFTLNRKDKIATAGSCFAQHISKTLRKHGFNYYIAESNPDLSEEEAKRRNFGFFSARFGNVYTARQLLQLFDRAFGTFTPADHGWLRRDKVLVDPFRPQLEPEGFSTVEDLLTSRRQHFHFVREMFENLDVFVFTLGLTEAWRNRKDGAIYPLAPGVAGGEFDASLHEFVNFRVSEVVADMQLFVERLLGVNPQARIMLTVSPVPLVATYEDRHVLVSNTYSKSVLRVAAEEVIQRNPMCEYFPSYEIITGHYSRGKYFGEDLRSITTDGVDHIMRVFISRYASESGAHSFNEELKRENVAMSEVVCEEEALDSGLRSEP